MAQDIITTIQETMDLPPLQKVDPNRDRIPADANRLAQAAIPAVLAGLFQASRSEEGAARIAQNKGKVLERIFGDSTEDVINKIARYAGHEGARIRQLMEHIAVNALQVIEKEKEATLTPEALRDSLTSHRHEILVYLPPELQLGGLLDDAGMDDRTNKMEGPVSSLMHKIEDRFSGGA